MSPIQGKQTTKQTNKRTNTRVCIPFSLRCTGPLAQVSDLLVPLYIVFCSACVVSSGTVALRLFVAWKQLQKRKRDHASMVGVAPTARAVRKAAACVMYSCVCVYRFVPYRRRPRGLRKTAVAYVCGCTCTCILCMDLYTRVCAYVCQYAYAQMSLYVYMYILCL